MASSTSPVPIRTHLARSLAGLAARLDPRVAKAAPRQLRGVYDSRGWFSLFSSGFRDFQTSKWIEKDPTDNLLAFSAIYACVTLIASDIAKLRPQIREQANGAWADVTSDVPAGKVLQKPNRYQTRLQFIEQWLISKMVTGNAYILKRRSQDRFGAPVKELYVLDPSMCRPLVAESGDVFYAVGEDNLSGVFTPRHGVDALPASEVIHDRMNCLFHPRVGVSPIFACGASATQGNRIQNNSAKFFENMSRPSGMLTAPAEISDETAERLKREFEQNFSGNNLGRFFVAGDSLEYKPITISAHDAQLVEQLRWTVEDVARAFRVPLHMLNAGAAPTLNSIEAIEQSYYSRTLQPHIEAIELCLDEGLGLTAGQRTEFDLDGLLRMDSAAMYEALGKGVGGGWMAPNEARARMNLPPVDGGASPLAQMQNFSLAALAKRDALPNPFDATGQQQRSGARGLTTKDMNMDELQAIVAREVAKAIAALPKPRDGQDGRDGVSVSRDEVLGMVRTEVADVAVKHLEALPKPRDGIDGAPGRDGRDLSIQEADTLLERHFDRRIGGLFDKAFEDRIEQIATKASLLVPPGRDGQPGAPGRPGTPGEDGRDGKDGADGRDGISADDLRVELVGRNLTIVLRKDGKTLASRSVLLKGLPAYTGTYVHGKKYAAGDMATYGGSVWCAKVDTNEPPKGEANAWQLCVKGTAR